MTKKLTQEQRKQLAIERSFESWWENEGVYRDPNPDEPDWYEKRKELCYYAFKAAKDYSND